ncbi:uncharacterized protein K452DRAFT_86542 [Aplosporella prunicola CBS 121167]|uniref:Uncharacterized protein n=1 Tax=Aplosporella prunicola CBS 121167 TaxID=1176127 RepID=A0A6A6B2M0_9PEZI|nr:uncharacterized protein K452DRAFT_86542 [Aplosporella prunicola CBS 121167]KAF2138429.1 hypothetical protein K452DRAFT_86542 [Aplosporella prunicola CBS 121167]
MVFSVSGLAEFDSSSIHIAHITNDPPNKQPSSPLSQSNRPPRKITTSTTTITHPQHYSPPSPPHAVHHQPISPTHTITTTPPSQTPSSRTLPSKPQPTLRTCILVVHPRQPR